MKNVICILLCLAMVLLLASCARDDGQETIQTEPPIPEHAPELQVQCADDSFTVKSGNYSWTSRVVSGETGSVIACGSHPLDGYLTATYRQVSGDTLALSFPFEPEEITVVRWSKRDVKDLYTSEETVEMENMTIPMDDGVWIYQITASWDEDGWGGQAEYHLYLTK